MLQLLTIKQVALLLALSPVTVTHWSYGHRPAPEEFPAPIKIGRQLRYLASDIDQWIVAQRNGGPTPSVQAFALGTPTGRRRGRPRKVAKSAPSRATIGARNDGE